MKDLTDIDDPRLVKALAHPLRMRILAALQNGAASPSEMAKQLRAPLGSVSYHVRVLARYDLIRLVRRTPRRGAIEHHYEAVGRVKVTDRAWAEVPPVVKEAMVNAMLTQIGDFVTSASDRGGFDRADTQVARVPLKLDAQGFSELAEALMELHQAAAAIAAQSTERVAHRSHEGEIHAGLVLMLFERAVEPLGATDAAGLIGEQSPSSRRGSAAS